MMCVNAAFTLYVTDQLPEISTQRCVGAGIEREESGFGGVHLAEAVDRKSGPGSQQTAASGRLKLKIFFYGMLHAAEMMAKRGIWVEPHYKPLTQSPYQALVFKLQGPTWDVLWQKSKSRKV